MPRTLLLVDQNPTLKRVVELSLASEDVEVIAATDADEAVRALSRSAPDIVLADIGSAGGGYEVAAHVSQTPSLARIPVVLLAGAFDEVDRDRASAAGAVDLLVKPVHPSILLARVRALLPGLAPQPSGEAASPRVATASPEPTPAGPATVDRYFAELDQAFADLASNPRPAPPAADVSDEHAPAADTPGHAPERAFEWPTPTGSTTVLPVPSGNLADAFAALLTAEQSGVVLTQSSTPLPAPPPPGLDIERLAEMVAARVLERLTDDVVKRAVADVVADTAERLVKEEIDRIKRNIP